MILSCNQFPSQPIYLLFSPKHWLTSFILSQGHCFDMLQWLPLSALAWVLAWGQMSSFIWNPLPLDSHAYANTSPLKPTKNSPPSGSLSCWVLYFCRPVPCHRCNWGCWDVARQVFLCLCCVCKFWFFPPEAAWICGEGRASGIWHEFVQQHHSWVLRFILAVLCHLGTAALFSCEVVFHPGFSRQLSPPCSTFLLSQSGQRALF